MSSVWRLSQPVFLIILLLLFGLTSNLQARSAQPHEGLPHNVLSFEPLIPVVVTAQLSDQPAGGDKKIEASFYAFGRQFDLLLEPHDLFAPDAENIWVGNQSETKEVPTTVLYKGEIKGEPGSWARVSMRNGVMDGMLWTKNEIYFVEPGVRFFASASPDDMVMYRLSDTVSDWEPGSCALDYPAMGAEMERHTDLHDLSGDYEALVSDLQALASGDNLRQLDLGIVADYAYFQKHGTSSAADMQNIINQIDGIFHAELGVTLRITKTVVYTTPSEPFSSTTDPVALLVELGQYKGNPTSPMHDAGLAHLFTNRDLNGNTIGIAWMGTVCNNSYGAGLSQDYTTNNKSLVILTAHEIGHNFSTPHDNQPGSSCASSPFGFIMNPSVSSQLNLQFSNCSKDFIATKVANASCLAPLADVPPGSPTPVVPTGTIGNTTPTFQRTSIPGATHTPSTPLNPTHTDKGKVKATNAKGASTYSSKEALSLTTSLPAPQQGQVMASGWVSPSNDTPVLKSNYQTLDGLMGDPWVLKEPGPAGPYVMYYGATKGDFSDPKVRIFRATSPDGIQWVRTAKPVLSPGLIGSWDAAKVETPSVLKLPDGSYRLYYTGGKEPGAEVYQIGLATSPDGITWKKAAGNPILAFGPPGSFDAYSILEPSVLYKEGKYWLWYAGISSTLQVQIGLATSLDGLRWKKQGVVLSLDRERLNADDAGVTEPHVLWNGQAFEMFYAVLQKEGQMVGPIWHAVSTDGKQWQKEANPLLGLGQEPHWTAQGAAAPSVLLEEGIYRLWYVGTHTDYKSFVELSIGYITKPLGVCGNSWATPMGGKEILHRPFLCPSGQSGT